MGDLGATPSLVLLPGLDGTGVLFQPFIEVLPPHFAPQVVTYPSDEPLGYEELLPRVLDSLPPKTPYLLLGESFSGPLALMVAARRPPGLRGIVLSATFIRNPLRFHPSWAHRLVGDWMFRWFPELSQTRALLGGQSTRARRDLVKEALSAVRPEVLAHRLRAVLQVDVRRELRDCPVPVLYLQAEQDWVVHAHNAAETKSCRPDVEVVKIPSPHLLLQTQPRLALQAISEFFGQS